MEFMISKRFHDAIFFCMTAIMKLYDKSFECMKSIMKNFMVHIINFMLPKRSTFRMQKTPQKRRLLATVQFICSIMPRFSRTRLTYV